ncbi:VOC family protein [Mycobacterium sp. smrl_JER01]|uniref:VOC family protein n=1 Tax=Mycobacterium sp. smrl_JER01 TaxID=3402633 RepID=UPI003ACB781B
MSAAPKLTHVVFQTGQPAEMRDWYCKVLDGHVVYQDNSLCFITFDDEHHRVALLTPDVAMVRKLPNTACAHHTAYTFENIDDLLDRYIMLRDQGVLPAVCIAHGVTTSMYYKDPDGNFAELQIDNFESPDEATGYMNGPEYAADSVGPAFDPEAMLEARRSGESAEGLTQRSWALKSNLPHPIRVLAGG